MTAEGHCMEAHGNMMHSANEGHCAEGYVMTNKFGSFKIIDREVFSYLNFNLSKNRDTN